MKSLKEQFNSFITNFRFNKPIYSVKNDCYYTVRDGLNKGVINVNIQEHYPIDGWLCDTPRNIQFSLRIQKYGKSI